MSEPRDLIDSESKELIEINPSHINKLEFIRIPPINILRKNWYGFCTGF